MNVAYQGVRIGGLLLLSLTLPVPVPLAAPFWLMGMWPGR